MKRTFVGVIASALLAVLAISLVSASEVRLQLNPVGGSTATGTAKIERDIENSGIQDVEIQVRVDSTPAEGSVFEGWLVDQETGFKLSMGAFKMDQRGRGKLQFEQEMVNFDIFDMLIVTTEPVNDQNPNPGTSVLEAKISGLVSDGVLDILSDNSGRGSNNSGRGSSNSGSDDSRRSSDDSSSSLDDRGRRSGSGRNGREDRITPLNGVVTSIIADNRGRGLNNSGSGRGDRLTVLQDQQGRQNDLLIRTGLASRQSNMGRATTFISSDSRLSNRNRGADDTHTELEVEHSIVHA